MSDGEEKRFYERVRVNKEFESVDAFVSEYVTDVSEGGVFIRSKNPQPVNSEVDLSFTILTDDFYLIAGKGRVVRVVNTPGHEGMAVVFTQLAPESKSLLDSLIDQHKSKLGI